MISPRNDLQELMSDPGYLQAQQDVAKEMQPMLDRQKSRRKPTAEEWNGEDALDFDLEAAVRLFLEDMGLRALNQEEVENGRDLDGFTGDKTVISVKQFDILASFLDEDARKTLRMSSKTTNYSNRQLLDTLASIALHPAALGPVAIHFKTVFLDIAARWLLTLGYDGQKYVSKEASNSLHQVLQTLSAFSKMLDLHQGLYPLFLTLMRHPLLQRGPFNLLDPIFTPQAISTHTNTSPPPTVSPSHLEYDIFFSHPDLLELLQTLHRIISALPFFPDIAFLARWKLPHPFIHAVMMRHPTLAVRVLAWHIIKKWSGFTASEGNILLQKWVSADAVSFVDPSQSDQVIAVDVKASGRMVRTPHEISVETLVQHADAWILPVAELNRLTDVSREICKPIGKAAFESLKLKSSDLTDLVVLVEGFLTTRDDLTSGVIDNRVLRRPASFVCTPPVINALKKTSLALSRRSPIILSSAPMAGKTSVLRHLSHVLGSDVAESQENTFVTINLADRSIDAKSLLGSLVSSTKNPGQFVFTEGTLTRAIRQGKWLVLEDLDKAADDVLALIDSIANRMFAMSRSSTGAAFGGLDSKHGVGLFANGRWIPAGPNFALLATCRRESADLPLRRFLGSDNWTEVYLDSPAEDDIDTILRHLYPLTSTIMGKRVRELHTKVREHANKIHGNGIRALLRWCARIERGLQSQHGSVTYDSNTAFQDEVFCEALDIFCGGGDSTSGQSSDNALAKEIGAALGLSAERIAWIADQRQPTFSKTASTVSFGRAHLPINGSPEKSARPFALSKWTNRLLERIAVATFHNEPVLLVGETGTGKTAAITHLAAVTGQSLFSLNMSIQTEVADLLGGYKPVDQAAEALRLGNIMANTLIDLLSKTFSLAKNGAYVDQLRSALNRRKWSRLCAMVNEASQSAIGKLHKQAEKGKGDLPSPMKRRKIENSPSLRAWKQLAKHAHDFRIRFGDENKTPLAFAYVEGPLVKAIQDGTWILLDEINLASSEMLQSIAAILSSPNASLTLTERGDVVPLKRHPNFKLFACMNPATDVGKRDLPPFLRQSFTEFYVLSPDQDDESLLNITSSYLLHCSLGDKKAIVDAVDVYRSVSKLAASRDLADGTNQPPHYSIRTFCRALAFGAAQAPVFGLRRALFEGFVMAFAMLLSPDSRATVTRLVKDKIFANSDQAKAALGKAPMHNSKQFQYGHYSIEFGNAPLVVDHLYVITPSVKEKLVDLMRAISSAAYPILLQGPTSSGKTSVIEYIAKCAGRSCIRINNHQHTDIQEYLGSYVSDSATGQLRFKDGLLVQALRTGSWIILDELNLAPSDVLEALNRLLDDNRQLVIPETQEVVNPHPNFMLFATQNPPASYAGRKSLSRAFRNRFLEFHFDDVPKSELQEILEQRCQIAPSYAAKVIQVFFELQHRRQSARIFEDKESFITLRDLFRWGSRQAVGYQELAEHGFMLVGERARTLEDRAIVKEVIETVMKVIIDEAALYPVPDWANAEQAIVWTTNTRRLAKLISEALKFKEPVLLVGETGGGKTSICEHLARVHARYLHTVNCHLNTDVSDILGGYRPNRDRISSKQAFLRQVQSFCEQAGLLQSSDVDFTLAVDFLKRLRKDAQYTAQCDQLLRVAYTADALLCWYDGPLVSAMIQGDMFLLDEISLVDDSVLERFNSVLEPARQVTLAEKATADAFSVIFQAHDNFRFLATMNPGGDYGKKELSPALRNRFTEIWVPAMHESHDFEMLLHARLVDDSLRALSSGMVDFARSFAQQVDGSDRVRLRDLLAWAEFILSTRESLSPSAAFCHGALLAYVDRLPSDYNGLSAQKFCLERLSELFPVEMAAVNHSASVIQVSPEELSLGPFTLRIFQSTTNSTNYQLDVPTVRSNLLRIVRALNISKPILLEGSPGVGKTSVVVTLARLVGIPCARVNLSAQTDINDLFGRDLPVVGGQQGEFAWHDAPFLQAMQSGHWVLLDEMNLAAQQILEGLNSCLDHRGDIFIAELGKTFRKHPNFRVFAAQNPLNEGGARKGLPASFLNRFTQIQIQSLTARDYALIAKAVFPLVDDQLLERTIKFNTAVRDACAVSADNRWEFNLRDVTRFFTVLGGSNSVISPMQLNLAAESVYFRRFEGRLQPKIRALFESIFDLQLPKARPPFIFSHDCMRTSTVNTSRKSVGIAATGRLWEMHSAESPLGILHSLALASTHGWPALVYSESPAKTAHSIRQFSYLAGSQTVEYFASSQTDSTDLLGAFEQHDPLSARLSQISAALLYLDSLSLSTQEFLGTAEKKVLDDAYATLQETKRNPALIEDLDSIFESIHFSPPPVNNGNSAKSFVWSDGPLLEAIVNGQHFVLHNAHLCPPAVLDRLNSLFEPNGRLSLTEEGALDGSSRSITAHPNFCMIMLADAHAGEVSRAMRNRSLEIYDAPDQSQDSDVRLGAEIAYRTFDPELYANLQQVSTLSCTVVSRARASQESAPVLLRMINANHTANLTIQKVHKAAQTKRLPLLLSGESGRLGIPQSLKYSQPLDPALWIDRSYDASSIQVSQYISTWIVDCFETADLLALFHQQDVDSGRTVNALSRSISRLIELLLTAIDSELRVRDFKTISAISNTSGPLKVFDIVAELMRLLEATTIDRSTVLQTLRWLAKDVPNLANFSTGLQEHMQELLRAFDEVQIAKMEQLWAAFLFLPRVSSWPLFDIARQLGAWLAVSDNSTHLDLRLLCTDLLAGISFSAERSSAESFEALAKLGKGILDQPASLSTLSSDTTQNFHQCDDAAFFRFRRILRDTLLVGLVAPDHSQLSSLLSVIPLEKASHAAISLSTTSNSANFKSALRQSQLLQLMASQSQWSMSTECPAHLRQIDAPIIRSIWSSSVNIETLAFVRQDITLGTAPDFANKATTIAREIVLMRSAAPMDPLEATKSLLSQLATNVTVILDSSIEFDGLAQRIQNSNTFLGLSQSAANLAQALWNSYVGSAAYDPAIAKLALSQAIARRKRKIMHEIAALQTFDQSLDTLRAGILKESLDELEASSPATEFEISRQSAPAKLDSLFAEIRQSGHFFSSEFSSALTGSITDSNFDIEQCDLAIANLATARERLSRNADYLDLVETPILALSIMILAIEARRQHLTEDVWSKKDLFANLIELPVYSSQVLPVDWSSGGQAESSSQMQLHVLKAAKSARLLGNALGPELSQRCRTIFHSAYQQWHDQQESEAIKKEMDGSIYFSRMSIRDEAGPENDAEVEEIDETETIFNRNIKSDISALSDAFVAIFSANIAVDADLDASSETKFVLLESTLQQNPHALESKASLVDFILHKSQQKTKTADDFHIHAHPTTTTDTIPLLDRLHQRVSVIIESWPDEMILHDIQDRIIICLGMNSLTPPARLLPNLERLVTAVNDWQSVASKEVSIADYQAALLQEIIRYRQIELSSWMSVLQLEEERFTHRAADWLFKLYALFHSTLAATEERATLGQNIFDAITPFLFDAPAGQFKQRLRLLQSFVGFFEKETWFAPIVASLVLSASRLINTVDAHIDSHRKATRKAVAQVTKIATWKDVNIEALRQSAEKSRKALVKCVKTYRKALQQSVGSLSLVSGSAVPKDPRAIHFPSQISATDSSFLANSILGTTEIRLDKAYNKVRSILAAFSTFQVETDASNQLENLKTTIIANAASLRQQKLPAEAEAKAKAVAALVTRKRRAFAQLLRGLRRIGASQNPSMRTLAAQKTMSLLHADGPIGVGSTNDNKFYNLLDSVENVRRSASQHSEDLSPAEVAGAIGSFESLLALLLAERKLLVQSHSAALQLAATEQHFQEYLGGDVTASKIAISRRNYAQAFDICTEALLLVKHLSNRLDQHSALVSDLKHISPPPNFSTTTQQLTQIIESLKDNIQKHTVLLLPSEAAHIESALFAFDELALEIGNKAQESPHWRYLIEPVTHRLDHLHNNLKQMETHSSDAANLSTISVELVQTILASVQDLNSDITGVESTEEQDALTGFVKSGLALASNRYRQHLAHTAISTILRKVESFDEHCALASSENTTLEIRKILPFLSAYSNMAQSTLARLNNWHATNLDFAQTIANLITELAAKGFCKPTEEETSGGQSLKQSNDEIEASGVGEGSGSKDISDQIENEGQVEGLEGEKDEDQDGGDDPQNRPDGIDASDLLPDDGFESDNALSDADDQGNDSGDEEDTNDIDDKIEAVDQDSSRAVDEKFWNGDDKDQPEPSNETLDQQTQQKQQQDAEMTAAEGQAELGEQDKDQEQPLSDKKEGGKQELDDIEAEDVDLETEDNESKPNEPNGAQMEEKDKLAYVEEDEGLDEATQDEVVDDFDDEMRDMSPEAEDQDNSKVKNSGEDQDDILDNDENPAEDLAETQPDEQADDAAGFGADEQENKDNSNGGGLSAAPEANNDEVNGEDTEMSDQKEAAEAVSRSGNAPESNEQNPENATSSTAVASKQAGSEQTEPSSNPSPLDKRENAISAWQKRLQNILRKSDQAQSESAPEKTGEQAEFEHADDLDESTIDALAPSTQAQAISMADDQNMDDVPQSADAKEGREVRAVEADPLDIAPISGSLQKDGAPEETVERGDLLMSSLPSQSSKEEQVRIDGAEAADSQIEMDWQPAEPVEEDIQPQAARFFGPDGSQLPAAQAWQQYVSRGQSQSFALTERLRLILEPTKASRLQGDYRSGKRLNMKRIIPYIASDFTKDKIWLKRTKPSDREYQVMVCVDDSVSMRDSRLIQLAFETLAMISTALNRLEVGQVAVARFGETVDILHAFEGGPVSAETGGKMLEQFTFAQKHTNYARLLATSLSEFSEARLRQPTSSGTDAELWQLQVIISDGMTSDKAGIRRLMRQASQQKVVVVFIIVDSPTRSSSSGTTSQQSILDIRTASYQTDASGRQQFVMERYLDSFPFESYVVVRQVDDLPDMLSRTLKQFFEMVTRS